MTDEFLRACYDERNEIAVELDMLADGQIIAASEGERVMRIRRLCCVLGRLDALLEELEIGRRA